LCIAADLQGAPLRVRAPHRKGCCFSASRTAMHGVRRSFLISSPALAPPRHLPRHHRPAAAVVDVLHHHSLTVECGERIA